MLNSVFPENTKDLNNSNLTLRSGLKKNNVLVLNSVFFENTKDLERRSSGERLFSQIGIAFSAKRKSAEADTLQHIMFARCNLP